jgi:signal transduction histidine kinase/DNA-binding response OmpR family regulator
MAGGTDLWLGTDTGRLIRWNYKTGVALMSADVMVGGKARAVVCLSPDGDGGVWLGTYLGGLNYYKNGSIKNYPTGNSGAIENIWALTPAGNGKLWIGTLGDGVLLYDPATQQSEVFNVKNCGLNSDYISSLIVSHEGRLYIATNSGLSVLDLPSKKLIKDDKSVLNQLNKANVVQVYEDRRKLIWIATDEGLYMYDSSKNKLTSVGLNSWSRNVYILGICEDIQGAMWVSSGSELIKINLIQNTSGGDYTFESRTYTRQEGLQNSDFNQRSFCTVPSGEVFVGGMYGVNSFDPLTMPSDATAPRVMFTDLKLFNNSVVVGERYDGIMVLSESLNDVDVVNLKYLQNEFTICFAADNYVAQETTTFYYRLLGFNDEWIKCVGNLPQVTYTNLPPGSYTIEVKAVSNDGVESDEVARLKIVVYPPFWLSWWAKTLYLLLILLAIYYSVMLIKRRERKKYIAQKKSEAIKQQEELNRLKFKFFANISHELRTPLTLILSPIEAMLKAANDDKQKHRLEIVYGNANKLLNLVNQLLDFRKTEVAELKYLPIKGNIISFIKNQCDAFNAYSEDKHVSLTFFSNGQSLMMDFDADKMGKIVMNLLSNAFKFTPDGGRVDVAVTAGDDKVVIKVADTGIGISDEDKQRIFDCFYQTDTSNSAGSGIGLSLVKEYVKLHNGDVKVVDNAGGGSVFIITIPIHSANADAVSDEDSTAAASTTASTPTTAAESANASAESATPTASLSESAPAADKNTKGNRGHKVAKAEEKHHVEEDHKPTVLVVDDNADLRTFVNEELSADYHVITAADGKAALDILENHVPDIVVTDIMMPGIDGIELCRRMKANSEWAGIPIVVLTAKQDVQAKVEGLTIGADDYITKPFNCDILKLRINKLLSLSRKGGRRQLIEPEPSHVKVTSVDEKLIESAVKYVEENMASPDLSVEEMSRHLGMSRVHLYKRIRQITGMTPIEFIRIMRLKRAAQLLRESQRNVSEIAYAVGFNNPKYFSKYFKDEFGVLPSVYQENEGK